MKILLVLLVCLSMISIISAYSTYGAPTEFGNDTTTTCYVGGDYGEVNCTGNATFKNIQGNISWLQIKNETFPVQCPDDTFLVKLGNSVICSSVLNSSNSNNSEYFQSYTPTTLYNYYKSLLDLIYQPIGNYLTTWLIPDTTNGYLFNDSTNIFFNDTKNNQTILEEGLRLGFNSTHNSTYDSKADYQFINNNFNGSGNFDTTGNITGKLTPSAGTTEAGTTPLKFTNGTLTTIPENGSVEYSNGVIYIRSDHLNLGKNLLVGGSLGIDSINIGTDFSISKTGDVWAIDGENKDSDTNTLIIKTGAEEHLIAGLGSTGGTYEDMDIGAGGLVTIKGTLGAEATTVTSLTDSALTSGRVTYATTGGLLTNDADLTFDGEILETKYLRVGGNAPSANAPVYFQKWTSGNYGRTLVVAISQGTASHYQNGAGAFTFNLGHSSGNLAEAIGTSYNTYNTQSGTGTTTAQTALKVSGTQRSKNTIGSMSGLYLLSYNYPEGIGAITTVSGLRSSYYNNNGTWITATGAYFENPTGGGNITNFYGFYSEALTYENITNYPYAFYSAGKGKIYFGDDVNATGTLQAQSYLSANGTAGLSDCYDSDAGGQVCSLNGLTTSITDDPSDSKFKDNEEDLNLDTSKFNLLQPKEWDWNIKEGKGYGLIADDLELVYPECVKSGNKIEMKKQNKTEMQEQKDIKYIKINIEDAFEKITINETINQTKRTGYRLEEKEVIPIIEEVPIETGKLIQVDVLKQNVSFDELTGEFLKKIETTKLVPIIREDYVPVVIDTYKTIDYLCVNSLQIKKIQELETENERIKQCSKSSKDFNEYKICIG